MSESENIVLSYHIMENINGVLITLLYNYLYYLYLQIPIIWWNESQIPVDKLNSIAAISAGK